MKNLIFMANNIVKKLLTFLMLITGLTLEAQDVSYSQFFNNNIYYNPAFTGRDLGLRMRLHHRNQWNNLPYNYDNYAFIMDVAERSIPGTGGLGLIVQSDFDGIGNIQTNSAALTYAVRIPITRDIITQFGGALSYVQKSIDYDNFIFSDQIDPRFPENFSPSGFVAPEFNTLSYPDFNFGLMLQFFESSRRINQITGTLSAAVHHSFRPDVSFTGNDNRLPRKYVFAADILLDNERVGYRPGMNNDFFYKLNPGFLYEIHGKLSNFMIGVNAYKNYVYAGVWLRSQNFVYTHVNDLIFLAGLHLPIGDESRLKFMYSYDYVISDARRAVGPTHEISLVFELDGFSLFGDSNMPRRNRAGCPECPTF